jgi:methenyltetrahydrofolate cyclohydrolase
MSTLNLRDLSLSDFTQKLAERTPTPGGGSVAAHLAALGAALGAMAFRFTSGPKFAALEEAMADRVGQLERIRARANLLIDEDSRAYELVMAGYKLPKATEPEKAVRSAAIQAGLLAAIAVPAETVELAERALELVAAGAADINPNVLSDCASGGWCLLGAAEAAFLNVQINAASLADKAQGAARLSASLERLRAARAAALTLNSALSRRIG